MMPGRAAGRPGSVPMRKGHGTASDGEAFHCLRGMMKMAVIEAATADIKRLALPGDRGFVEIAGEEGDLYFDGLNLAAPAHAAFLWVLENALPPDAAVLDVGANVGLTAMLCARYGAGPIHAFEPSPTAFRHLTETIARNGAKTVTAHPLAVGAAAGRHPFHENPQASAASHVVTSGMLGEVATTEVEVTTLDAFVAQAGLERVDLLKIDVQGHELEVLSGARETIDRHRPAAFVEVNAYTLIAFHDASPRALVEALLATFPHVHSFRNGLPVPIKGGHGVREFIHTLLTSEGGVGDVYCTFEPIGRRG